MKKISLALIVCSLLFQSCISENYSNGERIGVITQFSKTGIIWKSWEGHLNVTQTGMNSSVPFDFSIDNDNEPQGLVKTLDSAANLGWKVKLIYHETMGKNWFNNRGETNHFVTEVIVLDRNMNSMFSGTDKPIPSGRVDTILWLLTAQNNPPPSPYNLRAFILPS